ncbi:MAG: hypothetical protein M1514_04045 [Patescibacteria group bacterium]|nr:hypothetical protein [Patescibacteria group bacterium]
MMTVNDKGNLQNGQDNSWGERPHRGKGWFGNSKAHAEAGRKGGLARRRNTVANA